jgi:hypothetical protein
MEKKIQTKSMNNGIYVAPLVNPNDQLYTIGNFVGVGGLDKGAKLAGFTSLLQSDWWPTTGKAFELNIPGVCNSPKPDYLKSEGIFLAGNEFGDIKKLSYTKIRDIIKEKLNIQISKRQIAVIMGGPPCQGISLANSDRNPFDIRNELIFELLRLINEFKPKVGLIEQVPVILGENMIPLMNRVLSYIGLMTDYHCSYKVLNAMNYGARQDRRRIIFMLVRKDLNVMPSFPEPQPVDLSKVSVNALLPHIYNFSPGQFLNGIKPAKDNVFCTMTASGSEFVYELDGIPRKPTLAEKLVLTELEGYNLDGLARSHQNRLLGNMVQISFAEALFQHIKIHILKNDNSMPKDNHLDMAA